MGPMSPKECTQQRANPRAMQATACLEVWVLTLTICCREVLLDETGRGAALCMHCRHAILLRLIAHAFRGSSFSRSNLVVKIVQLMVVSCRRVVRAACN